MRNPLITVMAAAALLLSACGTPAAGTDPTASTPGGQDGAAIHFAAAASLTDVAPELTRAYAEETGDTTRIDINLGASSKLVQQANSGQQPDVLITADTQAPEALEDPTAFEPPIDLVSNTLVLAVPATSKITAADQLPEAGAVALCAPAVPCGRAANTYLDHQGFSLDTVSEEDNVRAVLTKVTAGQVDAGFVYATDAAAAGDQVRAIDLTGLAANIYPLLVATDAAAPAQDFARWLQGDAAMKLLNDAGFSAP
ncbi:MAG: molybdate ABC transporter substrate-binding protein [Micrococcaceae bacterium]|nr:molybdate ABC transporter substrate-binding protein [Micrococcaceae bacterium]